MKRASRGFTLIELMVVVALAAILLALAVPSFSAMLASYRTSAQLNGWIGDAQYARAEAIKRGQTVHMCISSNSTGAAPSCTSGASDWSVGWIVWQDVNANGNVDPGEVLRAQGPFAAGYSFIDPVNGVSHIDFNREGFAPTLPASPVALAMNAPTATTGTVPHYAAICRVGRARATSAQPSTADCS